ncbi:hypothetical protein JYQ62_03340 [Nostoc sp. UHCC 0702]|nr:hypothetical protein JYQ62_03340 [Nostoc sp. UHCC 0702]
MNNKSQLLDCDTDVLLFDKDTYIVGRFKELITEQFRQKFCTPLREHHPDYSVSGILCKLCINEVKFKAEDIIWQSSMEDIHCQVFRVGSTGWQAGKIRIKVSTEIINPSNSKHSGNLNIKVILEFCPDEPTEAESPLDDIRKMMQTT